MSSMTARRVLFAALVVLVAAALMLSGCSSTKSKSTTASTGKEPYVIGAIFSVTGDNAPLGVPEKETVQMLEKQINAKGGIDGHPVKVEYYDDAGKPDQASQACQKLLANKDVVAVIGPTLTGPSLAIVSMCQDAGMPYVSCAASVKIVQPVQTFVFKTAQTDSLAVLKLLDYMKAKNIKSVGFINDANAFGMSGRDQWVALSGKAGVKTVATESFNSDDTDMTSQLTKIKAKNPDAILCWGTNPGPAIVAKNAKTLGMKQVVLMSHGIANKGFIDLAQDASEGVVFPAGKLLIADSIASNDPQKEVLVKYAADYNKEFKKGPNTFGGHAYDAFTLVTNALEKAGSDKAKIRENIEKENGFVGITGVFKLCNTEHCGLDKNAFAMVKIKGGKWVLAD